MLKLTYSCPHDPYSTVTVLGDAKGLWDLWWRLTRASPGNPQDKAEDVRVETLCGRVLDPGAGLAQLLTYDQPLSKL